jgi:hypothetical protein
MVRKTETYRQQVRPRLCFSGNMVDGGGTVAAVVQPTNYTSQRGHGVHVLAFFLGWGAA